MGRENVVGIFKMPQDPDESDLFRVALRALEMAIRTHTMGTIVSYNPATQRAVVLVDILQVVDDNTKEPTAADPSPEAVLDPVKLVDVPVSLPRATTGYITFPILPGCKGELHVQDRSIDQWLALGRATDPVAAWAHSLADSIFHPTILNDSNPISPTTSLLATVLHGDTLIWLGRLATHPVLKGTPVMAAFGTWTAGIATAGATWTSAGGTPPANTAFIGSLITLTATLAGTIAGWPSDKTLTE